MENHSAQVSFKRLFACPKLLALDTSILFLLIPLAELGNIQLEFRTI